MTGGGDENLLHGVPLGDRIGIEGGQGVVPEAEEATDFVLSDGLVGVNALHMLAIGSILSGVSSVSRVYGVMGVLGLKEP